jgi:N-methylhydantoinase A
MSVEMVGVDVGGTFTDVVAIDGGRVVVAKVPTDVVSSDRSVLAGAARVSVAEADVFNLASTAGLNAVITRQIPKIAFLTTLGHRDVLDRGRIGRPIAALMDMSWRRGTGDTSRPLVPRYLRRGICERITAQGDVLIPLDEEQARRELALLRRCGVEGVAICLINAYVDGSHERRLRELVAEELGDVACSISSEVSPLAREFARSSTTVVDVIMKKTYAEYTQRLDDGLRSLGFRGTFNYADCGAQLLPADYAMERPFQLVVGGPAAGTVAGTHFGRFIDEPNLICADVGGTSCDISAIIDGRPWTNTTFELEHDLLVNAPSIDIVTLGAGGGSVVSISPTTGEVQVGPESVGANPGPACYGQGGGLPTLTDAALLMGLLDESRFLDGQMQLRVDLAEKAFDGLDTSLSLTQRVQFAWGIALNNIGEGIRNIAIRRGIDVREFSLLAFGAAGPMILPGLLDVIPIQRVIVPPHPGLFSAMGLVSADRVYSDHRSAYMLLDDEAAPRLDALYGSMEDRLRARLGPGADGAQFVRSFDGQLLGQSWETPMVEVPPGQITPAAIDTMIRSFHDAYERRNGNRFAALPVQTVTFRVQLVVPTKKVVYEKVARGNGRDEPVPSKERSRSGAPGETMREYERDALTAGQTILGPAVIREALSTTALPLGRTLTVGDFGHLVIE